MRRRKPKVVWLPATNVNTVDSVNSSSAWSFASVALQPDDVQGGVGTIEVPIVLDGSQSDPLDPTSSLADIESSGYRLRRIVGKIFCFIAQQDAVAENIYGVTAGFIIRRTAPNGTSLAATSASPTDRLDPAQVDNTMDPWIWRRSWLLSDGPIFSGAQVPLLDGEAAQLKGRGPTANYFGGSGGTFDGPHVDQKTARIVGPEERLFLDVSATNILGSGNGATTSLVVIYEFRVLASMRSNVGNRRNASR